MLCLQGDGYVGLKAEALKCKIIMFRTKMISQQSAIHYIKCKYSFACFTCQAQGMEGNKVRGDLYLQSSKKWKALLVDAGGTLLQTVKPVEETYASFGMKYGVKLSPVEIRKRFKMAFEKPWPKKLRYEGDGKDFWRHVVEVATGCGDEMYFEELYQHFSRAIAWRSPIGAYEALNCLKDAGVKLAVVSNFDTRLRPLLQELNLANLFTAIIISSEIGYEKPAPQIFEAAFRQLDVTADEAVLLGDDPIADKEGAKAVGLNAWLWKKEIHSFQEIVDLILEAHV